MQYGFGVFLFVGFISFLGVYFLERRRRGTTAMSLLNPRSFYSYRAKQNLSYQSGLVKSYCSAMKPIWVNNRKTHQITKITIGMCLLLLLLFFNSKVLICFFALRICIKFS